MRELFKRLADCPADGCDFAIQTLAIVGVVQLCGEVVIFVLVGLQKLLQ